MLASVAFVKGSEAFPESLRIRPVSDSLSQSAAEAGNGLNGTAARKNESLQNKAIMLRETHLRCQG
jgi:hypothetical protein